MYDEIDNDSEDTTEQVWAYEIKRKAAGISDNKVIEALESLIASDWNECQATIASRAVCPDSYEHEYKELINRARHLAAMYEHREACMAFDGDLDALEVKSGVSFE